MKVTKNDHAISSQSNTLTYTSSTNATHCKPGNIENLQKKENITVYDKDTPIDLNSLGYEVLNVVMDGEDEGFNPTTLTALPKTGFVGINQHASTEGVATCITLCGVKIFAHNEAKVSLIHLNSLEIDNPSYIADALKNMKGQLPAWSDIHIWGGQLSSDASQRVEDEADYEIAAFHLHHYAQLNNLNIKSFSVPATDELKDGKECFLDFYIDNKGKVSIDIQQ